MSIMGASDKTNEARVKHEKIANEQLVALIRAGENESENLLRLWQQNKGFIAKLAIKYQGHAEMDDLKQEGYIGLCEAVRHYDTGSGVPFVNYAAFWIKQTMQRYVENCGGVVRIPSHAHESLQKYRRFSSEYKKYYGREPSEKEICGFLGISREKLQAIKKSAEMGRIASLSAPIAGEDEELMLGDMVASEQDIEADVCKALDTASMKKELWIAVDQLPDELPGVIRKRYQECMTLEETGRTLGVNGSRVRDIQAKALRMLRTERRSKKFRCYYEEYLAAAPVHHVSVSSFQRTWLSEVEREVLGW